MKNILFLLVLLTFLTGCSKDNLEEQTEKQTEEQSKEVNEQIKDIMESSEFTEEDMATLEIANEKIGLTTDDKYKENMDNNEKIIDANMLEIESLGIAYLTINVNEKITKDEAVKIAEEEETKLKKNNENMALVTIIQYNGEEIYNSIDSPK